MRTLVAAALLVVATAAHSQYPQRPVQLIVPWGAGGGTDATARIVGTLLEKELKQPFNVVNRTGGSGVVGHDAIAKATPDGYTIGMITVEITMMHHVGLTPLTYKDYTPIGLMNADPAGINVRVDSPYKSVKELLAAIRPGNQAGPNFWPGIAGNPWMCQRMMPARTTSAVPVSASRTFIWRALPLSTRRRD